MEIPDDVWSKAVTIYDQHRANRGWSLIDLIADELKAERERATKAENERCAKIAECFFQDEAGKRYAPFDVPNIIGANIRRGFQP